MDKLTGELVIGVFIGTVTTFLLFLVKEFWTKTIQPNIERLFYKDIRVDGEWEVVARYDPPRSRKMYIHQQAHRVTGELVSTQGSDNPSKWKLEGEIHNLVLTLTYAAVHPHSRGRGTITLIVTNGGERLEGYSAYLSTGDGKADDVSYVRYECQSVESRPIQG